MKTSYDIGTEGSKFSSFLRPPHIGDLHQIPSTTLGGEYLKSLTLLSPNVVTPLAYPLLASSHPTVDIVSCKGGAAHGSHLTPLNQNVVPPLASLLISSSHPKVSQLPVDNVSSKGGTAHGPDLAPRSPDVPQPLDFLLSSSTLLIEPQRPTVTPFPYPILTHNVSDRNIEANSNPVLMDIIHPNTASAPSMTPNPNPVFLQNVSERK